MAISDNKDYEAAYGDWSIDNVTIPIAETYRIAWREMAATRGFRALYPALIPPGAKHVNAVNSAGPIDSESALLSAVGSSSILCDFFVRATRVKHVYGAAFNRLPLVIEGSESRNIIELFLRLNCLTSAYSPIWKQLTGEDWTTDVPLRIPLERERAQIYIDVVVAIGFGLSVEELCTIYRTQFPVMKKYDEVRRFDQNGRLVPSQVLNAYQAGTNTGDAFGWKHQQSDREYNYYPPFEPLDREAEFRKVYSKLIIRTVIGGN